MFLHSLSMKTGIDCILHYSGSCTAITVLIFMKL